MSSTPIAERMRLYRKRRGQGLQFVRIPLHVTEIDKLSLVRQALELDDDT
jgi:hypothetical protein